MSQCMSIIPKLAKYQIIFCMSTYDNNIDWLAKFKSNCLSCSFCDCYFETEFQIGDYIVCALNMVLFSHSIESEYFTHYTTKNNNVHAN